MDGSISQGDFLDNAEPAKPKDATAAERQRRYRRRKRNAVTDRNAQDRNAVTVRGGTLMQPQAGVGWEVTEAGDLILRQEGQSEGQIFIAADYLDGFLETLYALDASPPPATPPAEEGEPEPVTPDAAVTPVAVTPVTEDEDEDGEEDDDSVVVEARRRIRTFWNKAGSIIIEAAGIEARDYDIMALEIHEADAAAKAILRLLDSEETTAVEDGDST